MTPGPVSVSTGPPDPSADPAGPVTLGLWGRMGAGLASAWPALSVLAFAAWLLWPVPRGHMPLSADHTVHLTRIVLTARRIGDSASLSGWEPTWFFGFPLGDLYPQLGDLGIIAIHSLGLGALDWPQAYALGFYLVFALQGLVLIRVARLFGFGPWPGVVAALLMLADAGFTREGGWMYTVYFGVWPQALATSLAWLGLGELARGLGWRPSAGPTQTPAPNDSDSHTQTRATLWAGLCFGGALLAHPIALPTLAIGGLVMALTLIPRGSVPWRLAVARCVLAAVLGAALAAWWWLPMLQHRAWMASYGWLFAPLETMFGWLREGGSFTQRMPMAVGVAAGLGLILASLGAGRFARFVALFALLQWLLASSDVFWELRLDRFSEGFTHLQYQRFLIGAKPGLFLCAGLAVSAPLAWARAALARARLESPPPDAPAPSHHSRGPNSAPSLAQPSLRNRIALFAAALGLGLGAAALGVWLVQDTRASLAEHGVGEVQTERIPNDPDFDADYAEFTAWAAEQWTARETDYRISVRAPRNQHWFMDAPVWTDTPQHKQGFTPGDNFVHKPESGQRALLNALGVRWVVSRGRRPRPARASEVARFGAISVRPQPGEPWPLVSLRPGPDNQSQPEQAQPEQAQPEQAQPESRVELLEADPRGGIVEARILDPVPGQRVVFAIAGYPRWRLSLDGEPLSWMEVPVLGEGLGATLDERRAGVLRGGKARGDDGSEPTLIAATLPESVRGQAAVSLSLRYHGGGAGERIADLSSLLAVLLIALGLLAPNPNANPNPSPSPSPSPDRRVRRWASRVLAAVERSTAALASLAHPVVLGALVTVGTLAMGAKWYRAANAEAQTLFGWVAADALESRGVERGPVKTDMLIRPAVILRPRPGAPAQIDLTLDRAPARIEGWLGLDDDQAQQRGRWARHELRIEARLLDPGEGGEAGREAGGEAGGEAESAGETETWRTLWTMSVAHTPRRTPFVVETQELAGHPVALRIIDETRGRRLPRLGLDLDLGATP